MHIGSLKDLFRTSEDKLKSRTDGKDKTDQTRQSSGFVMVCSNMHAENAENEITHVKGRCMPLQTERE